MKDTGMREAVVPVGSFFGGLSRGTSFKPIPWTRCEVDVNSISFRRPFGVKRSFLRHDAHVELNRRYSSLEFRWVVTVRSRREVLVFTPIRFRRMRRCLEDSAWLTET